MTVIVYRNGILAADSRCSDDFGMHLTNVRKIYRLKNGALLGCAGDVDIRDLQRLLEKSSPRNLPSRQQLADLKLSVSGILVFPKGQVFSVWSDKVAGENEDEWCGQIVLITDDFVSVGSGQQYAYGAMEHGATAQEAVRTACKRDLCCALPLQWESVDGRTKSVPGDTILHSKKR